MSMLRSDDDPTASRILLVAGAKATGKTTFVTSGSQFTPEKIPHDGKLIECSDVCLLQNDSGGHEGPRAVGLKPIRMDLSGAKNKMEWDKLFNEAYKEIHALFVEKKLRILGIDLTALDKILRDMYVANANTDTPKNWEQVTSKALAVYRLLKALPNATIVGMTHLAVQQELTKDGEQLERLRAARDASSVGGERSLTTYSLTKGHKEIWMHNANQIFVMRRKRAKVKGERPSYMVRLEGNSQIEAGGRWRAFFDADEQPAHLYSILKTVYKDKA